MMESYVLVRNELRDVLVNGCIQVDFFGLVWYDGEVAMGRWCVTRYGGRHELRRAMRGGSRRSVLPAPSVGHFANGFVERIENW